MIAATITKILEQGQRQHDGQILPFQTLEALVTSGAEAGQTRTIQQVATPQSSIVIYAVGDKVWLEQTQVFLGETVVPTSNWIITDYNRQEPLLVLTLLFAVLVMAVSRWRGFWSLVALAGSFMVITFLTVPLILAGWNPILVSILAAGCILPMNFYLSHGWELKTHIAIGCTIVSLILTATLAQVFIQAAHLSGFASEEANFLMVETDTAINFQNLILAAVIVGALGILDDLTVSQTSVVFELKKANQKFGWRELYTRGMRIGQDHIGSLVNTLILVYTGAALPLLLMFHNSPRPFAETLSMEIMAEEIIKTLTASIGLILAAPLTTFVTAIILGQNWLKPETKTTESHSHHSHH